MASEPLGLLPAADPLDGTEWVYVVQNGSSRKVPVSELNPGGSYHYGSFAVDSIAASEILMDHIVATAHTIAADFAGCVASVGTPPAAPWVATIFRTPAGAGAGEALGTLTIDAAGAVTFSATAAVAIAIGDVVSLIAPVDVDAAIARLRFTMKGTI